MADTPIPHPPDEADALALIVAWATGVITLAQVALVLGLDPALPDEERVTRTADWMATTVAAHHARALALVAARSGS